MKKELTKEFVKNCLVVLTAGGEGSRFRSVPGSNGVHKTAFELPTGETMIERMISFYRDMGIMNYVVLVFTNADSIKNRLGDGKKLGVHISYSHDPGKPVGRGGAIQNAVKTGHIKRGNYLIVHNPDDQLIGNHKEIIGNAISTHLKSEKRGTIATAVMADGTRYEFTGFGIKDGLVTDVEMYPFVKIPTHIGMTIFSPASLKYFEKLFNPSQVTDFEAVLFPILAEEKKLAAHIIPSGSWISVNDEKGLKKLLRAIDGNGK